MNAFDFAIIGVLMKEVHPMEYRRRKLQYHEWVYPIHEK
jgi:hypothetical protein